MAAPSLPDQLQSKTGSDSLNYQRIALVIQYVGTQFHGWQRQAQGRTVQGEIEQAIGSVLGHPVTLHGAGRTDAGVHAAAQMAHFDAPACIPAHRWRAILNPRLPQDIVVRAATQVPEDWHAQFSAQWRRYRYTLYTDALPNLFVRPFAWHYYYQGLDDSAIGSALGALVGHHDLAAFQRAGSKRPHSWVDLQEATCYRRDPFLLVEMQAAGFLYGMVRLVVGLVVQVGRGILSVEEFTHLWRTGQRDRVKYAAPANGLCLLRVGYDPPPFPPSVWFDTQPQPHLATPPAFMAV
ncbi:tRNA pseudouridine(38-40) synthase TruA [Leptolyngbya sp. PCC 6406]|uniref:tRNA pseudouridine(38-40) synthase TruA n=1 Tax=Leptolyngbya sp. PCC 6406 TaxID=1173264 RepID=UPI0002AC2B59|nr:tRNA pseudouridine(38-40) synthase TruA [Leptolyngbya sp. PCC 6406]